MQTVSEIIEALGGVTEVARRLGKPVGTVSAWKTRESIPMDQAQSVVDVARDVGCHDVTPDLIVRLHAPHPTPTPAAAAPATETLPKG